MHARVVRGDAEFQRCLEIRRIVFIEEQRVEKHLELDGMEAVCTHFLVWPERVGLPAEAVGTARLWIDSNGVAKAQRVAVLESARGQGAGRSLMTAIEREARRSGQPAVVLGAQVAAIPFYERIGYAAYGEAYDDAGIPHRMMRRDFGKPDRSPS